MQQDAHEFLNFLINRISEIILGKLLFYIALEKVIFISVIILSVIRSLNIS